MKNIERVNQKDGNCIVCGKPLVETIERFGQKADLSLISLAKQSQFRQPSP